MRSSGTESTRRRARRRAALWLAWLALVAPAAAAAEEPAKPNDEDLDARGSATLGANLYIIDHPYDSDALGGFFDQYLYTKDKSAHPPYFVDLMQVEFGLFRDDDTQLLEFDRHSPNQLNDQAELSVDWSGIGFDVDYWRFRTEQLRLFPQGTYQGQTPDGSFLPVFGTQYTPDATLAVVQQSDRRFWIRRTGIDGEIRFRPEAAGFSLPVLAEASLGSGYEQRKGWRQDGFVLDASEFTPGFAQDQRFRGWRRRVDQHVTNVGGGFVLSPSPALTADFDVDFESFREDASPVTSADIFPNDPAPQLLTFGYVPDTNRVTGSTRVGANVGGVNLHGSAFVTHLAQSNRAPVRRKTNENDVTTWSLHGGFDAPIGDRFDVAGFLKFVQRRNGTNLSDIAPDGSGDPLLTQVAPLIRRRDELDGEIEVGMRPRAGALVAAGYRFDYIDRKLRYGSGFNVIEEDTSLVEHDSLAHTAYLRGRARMLRTAQLTGEIGLEYQPEVSFPSDARHTFYFDGRGSYALSSPVPLTFALFGGVADAHGTGIVLDGASTSVRKDLDQLGWSWGATVTAVPCDGTTLATTFTQSRDEQQMPYARTQFPRYFGGVTIFEESQRVHWRSDVKSLMVSASRRITERVSVVPFANVSWVKADFPNTTSNPTDLANVLEAVNEIDSRLLGVGANLSWQAHRGLELGLGYRFDHYVDHEDQEPITRDDERHTFTLTATVDLDLLASLTD